MLGLIASFSDPSGAHESAAERIAAVLDRYQEQPSILDPQLEAMVTPLLVSVRLVARGERSNAVLPHSCRVMYTLGKVRGYKTIVKFCPHEVADLEPLVHLLAKYPAEDCDSWQIAYALMVWLSMVVMVPFDLTIIDSSSTDGAAEGGATLVDTMISLARRFHSPCQCAGLVRRRRVSPVLFCEYCTL